MIYRLEEIVKGFAVFFGDFAKIQFSANLSRFPICKTSSIISLLDDVSYSIRLLAFQTTLHPP